MFSIQLLFQAALQTIVSAATLDINVADGSLVFNPSNVTAMAGDLLNFHFIAAPHSIAQSTFEKPCMPSKDGIWSGVSWASGSTVRGSV